MFWYEVSQVVHTGNMNEKEHTGAVGTTKSVVPARRRIAAAAGGAVWGKRRRHVEVVCLELVKLGRKVCESTMRY